jgi:lipoic acid synthetase
VDEEEPAHVARAVDILGLNYAVVTSVTRDDLPDGGAEQFARVIRAIKQLKDGVTVEVLTPDFKGCRENIETVLNAAPEVFNHNVETVPRLYEVSRRGADYRRSLEVLKAAAESGNAAVKSGIIVGLGETTPELIEVFHDLAAAGVGYLTIGQYLSPSKRHLPVVKYYHPLEFEKLARDAEAAGIRYVFSGPLVRSSYHAKEQYLGSR